MFSIPAENVAEQKIAEDPAWASLMHETRIKMENGVYTQDLVDAIVQPWGGYSLGDVYLFAHIWGGLINGKILYAQVQIGEEPEKDRLRSENQLILNRVGTTLLRGESYDFDVWVDPNQQNTEGDGTFSWRKLKVASKSPMGSWESTLPARSIRLEIGTTRAATTLQHILYREGVARWPYSNKWITVLVPNPEVDFHKDGEVSLHRLIEVE